MTEAGILPGRTEFVRENEPGVFPASSPDYKTYSDAVQAFEETIEPQTAGRGALGSPDTEHSEVTVEGTEVTVTYDLQRWLVDGSGDPLDAAYDGIARDASNRLPNTHSVVRRTDQTGIAAGNTVSGSTSRDRRNYFVGIGGRVAEVAVTLEPGDTPAWQVELTYQFERVNRHAIDQPTDGEGAIELWVSSDDAADDGTVVTIEDEDAGTTEDVTLDSSADQQTTATFDNVDAVWADADLNGNVQVYVDQGDGTAPGDQIMQLYGASAYDHDQGDRGVPPVADAANREGEIGTGYELSFDGDTIERPSGEAIAENVGTHTIEVANNVEPGARATSPSPSLDAGAREVTIESTIWGEAERRDRVVDALQSAAKDYVWTPADGDSLTVGGVKYTTIESEEEVGQGRLEIDATLAQQESVTIA